MKFELNTDNGDSANVILPYIVYIVFISLIITISTISLQLRLISRNYEITYLCRVLIVEKSSPNFKKLSKLLNQTNKQKIWDLCREFVK